jgi:hypothetical protein
MTYEERGRGIFGYNGVDVVMDPAGQRWPVGERPRVTADFSQWNESSIIARGNRLEHKVNGRTTSVFIDHDEKNRALSGLIAIQLHAGTRKIDKPKVVSAQGINPPAKKATPPAKK